jgi:methylated-DNA-[protein]-cysteine S-methyltransferase
MSKKEINSKIALAALNFQLHIHYDSKGIQSASLHPSKKEFQWIFYTSQPNSHLECIVNQWFEDYCHKRSSFLSLPFDWTSLPLFTQQALQVVASIPFGTVLTYGQVADRLGRPEAARAVGSACRRNPFLLLIPCHRVLDAKFELRGYSAGGIEVKRKLLTFEKVML